MGNDLGSSANKPFYMAVWRRVLTDWLHWPDERIERWMRRYDEDLEDRGDGLFYHEEALWYVAPLLISDRLTQRLGSRESMRLEWRLQRVIGVGKDVERNPAFDWDAARERVEAVLGEYGETLAGSEDNLVFVKRQLGQDCP